MITTILTKVLNELSAQSPDLSYIRGMVEVLLASETPSSVVERSSPKANVVGSIPTVSASTDPEAQIMDAMAKANLETVKKGMMVE